MISAPDGSTYVGSGNEGQIYKVDASGKGSVFFDAEELEVHAMALAPGGGLYAGTSPDGKIYKIDAAGKSSVLFDPPDKYIWGLAVDKAGNVFAATGDKGVVYKITPDGKGSVFYQTKTTHAISLAIESDAIKLSDDGLMGAADLDTAAKAKNDEAINAARGTIGATCRGCHMVHRSPQLPDMSYEINVEGNK